jgi:hypothetical protein
VTSGLRTDRSSRVVVDVVGGRAADGQLRGWINPAGYVWYRTGGAAIGRVDVTSRCGPACRHTQARQMLDRLR